MNNTKISKKKLISDEDVNVLMQHSDDIVSVIHSFIHSTLQSALCGESGTGGSRRVAR